MRLPCGVRLIVGRARMRGELFKTGALPDRVRGGFGRFNISRFMGMPSGTSRGIGGHALSYLLILRIVLSFTFWRINLVPPFRAGPQVGLHVEAAT